jgi:two-component system, sporulation sensor kinase E
MSPTILLVNDRPEQLLAIQAYLPKEDCTIVTASSGTEALRRLLHESFAVILLDVNMPDVDGFETASLIRQRPQSRETPIIFITALDASEERVVQGYSLGAVDFIFMPVIPEILQSKVGVFLDLYRAREQVRAQGELLRANAERRADQLETRLRALLGHLQVGVFRLDTEGTLVEANPALLELLGADTLDAEARSRFAELLRAAPECVNGNVSKRDVPVYAEDGSRRWFSLTCIARHDEREGSSIEGVLEDVTARAEAHSALEQTNEALEQRVREKTEELRQSWERMHQAERLASLGTLAAGIAHEINNPLNSMRLAVQYALRKSDPKVHRTSLSAIATEIDRCERIVKGVLQFARNERASKASTALNEILQHAASLAGHYVTSPVSIETDLPSEPVTVMCNALEIEQVIVNLIQNASEASPHGAHVQISLRSDDQVARITVRDQGPGIPREFQGQIFDPFFTTHGSTGGTGLGLSIVHSIITDHRGTITVESDDGGTSVVMTLPRAKHIHTNLDAAPRRTAHG